MGALSGLQDLGSGITGLIFGLGIALVIGGAFLNSLTAGTTAYNSVNNILNSVGSGISNYFGIIVTVIFLGIVFVVAIKSGFVKKIGG